MSRPKAKWWGYVKSMMYRYPDHDNADECAAVAAALEQTKRDANGADKLRLVELVFFKKTHKLVGAAMLIPCDYETAKRWQQQFIRRVAANFVCIGLKE